MKKSGDSIQLSPDFKTFIPFREAELLADVQLCDNRTVTLDILLGEVVEQTAALADHLVHAQTAVVVVGMIPSGER